MLRLKRSGAVQMTPRRELLDLCNFGSPIEEPGRRLVANGASLFHIPPREAMRTSSLLRLGAADG
jgi:hypothetical protein